MQKKNLSIVELAKHLGVSKSTVSSVLNGKTKERRISEETRKIILDYIEQSGFRPNALARSLRTGKSKIIGMLVEDVANPFFAEVSHLVEQKLAKLGYRILLSSTENDNENAAEAIATFQERQVEGYIIVPPTDLSEVIKQDILTNSPCVIFDRMVNGLNVCSVQIDNYNSMTTATRHLINNGYQHIAFVTIKSDQMQMTDRLRGYKETIRQGLLKTFILKVDRRNSVDEIKKNIANFLLAYPQLDAVIFATNYIALIGMQVLKMRGLNAPEKIGVIGFDDSPYYMLMTPSVTSIVQPVSQIAEGIVELLLLQLQNGSNTRRPHTLCFNCELIERESTVRT